jgi:hypothetical protein
MFPEFDKVHEALLNEMRLWTAAIRRHREQLEAKQPERPTPASNGQHAAETRPARARR